MSTRRIPASPVLWSLPLLGYSAFIFQLSSQASLPTPNLFAHQDKLLHAGAYGVMALLAMLAFRTWPMVRSPLRWALLYCLLYGLSDELHQSLVPGRYPDPLDWLADTLGAATALLLWSRLRLRWRTRSPTPPA